MDRHTGWLVRTLAVAATGMTVGLLSTAASAQEIRNDVQDLRQDRKEIRQDNREIRGDRRELRGDTKEIQGDRRELQGDRRDLRDAYKSGDPNAARTPSRTCGATTAT
jgi:uncharacterized protein (DUF3084 family)